MKAPAVMTTVRGRQDAGQRFNRSSASAHHAANSYVASVPTFISSSRRYRADYLLMSPMDSS